MSLLHLSVSLSLRVSTSVYRRCSRDQFHLGRTLLNARIFAGNRQSERVFQQPVFYLHSSCILCNIEPISADKKPIRLPPISNTSSDTPETTLNQIEKTGVAPTSNETTSQLINEPKNDPPKLTLWQKVKKEVLHYYHGFRLLGLEVKIASGICFRLFMGETLTRRERKQLVRTVADIIRLVPFAVFVIVPFMEFLLPFYLRFFPFMLPSTFKDKGSEAAKIRSRLKAKLEMTRFLQETLNQTASRKAEVDNTPTFSEFQAFLAQVQKSGQPADMEEITRFSKLFEDQITLDSLETKQLKMLCQLLSLPTIGPSNLLRFQIWMRVRQLRAEDRLIAKEGVDTIPPWELQSLCQERGMRSAGLTEGRLRSQLNQWLTMHLEKNVPVTLLLFSQALHVTKASLDEIPLQQAIAQLPPAVSEEATAVAMETTRSDDVDPRTRIEVLRKEQANIKAERVQRRQAAAKAAAEVHPTSGGEEAAVVPVDEAPGRSVETAVRKPEKEVDLALLSNKAVSPDTLPTAATAAVDRVDTVGKQVEKKVEEDTEITVGDLTQIGTAIAESSDAMNRTELHELKEEVAATVKRRVQMDSLLVASDQTDKKTSKAAARLGSRVDRMIAEMSGLIDNLFDERQQLLKEIELREVHVKHSIKTDEKEQILDAIKVDHNRVIDINDLLLTMKRIQKVPDDTKWQKILQVLDEDKDGKIELQHVLSVIRMLGSENVKLSSKEVTRVLEMLDNEELADRIKAAEPVKELTAEDTGNMDQSCGCSGPTETSSPNVKIPFTLPSSPATPKPSGKSN